jgi:hypothetical protein
VTFGLMLRRAQSHAPKSPQHAQLEACLCLQCLQVLPFAPRIFHTTGTQALQRGHVQGGSTEQKHLVIEMEMAKSDMRREEKSEAMKEEFSTHNVCGVDGDGCGVDC